MPALAGLRRGDAGRHVGRRGSVALARCALALALCALALATACASRHATVRQDGVVVGDRWKDLSYVGGALGPGGGGAACDLVVERDRIVLGVPSTSWKSCPVAAMEIPGHAITRVGYARGDAGVVPAGFPPFDLIAVPASIGTATHVVSIGFREAATGAERAVTLSFVGRGADRLLRAIGRMGRTSVLARAPDAAHLPADLPLIATPDPLRVLVDGVPRWETRVVPLPVRGSEVLLSPDGSVALAGRALWSVPDGRLFGRLPRDADGPSAFSRDARTLVVSRTSGAVNARGASRASALLVFDTSQGLLRARIPDLPYLLQYVLDADGTRAYAIHAVEPSISAIDIDRAGVAWRSPLARHPIADLRGAAAWSAGVLAFGWDWVGVWHGDSGEPVHAPGPVLDDLPPAERPIGILDVHVIEAPPRLLVLYTSNGGLALAEADITSGRSMRTARLLETLPRRIRGRHWFSEDGARLLIASGDDAALLVDTASLAVAGRLVLPQRTSAACFDTTRRRVATAVEDRTLWQTHVIVWDADTARPVGQCLLDATGTLRFAPDGRVVVGAPGHGLFVCEPAGEAVTP